MYMSYCRYEGTFSELRACLGDAQEHINEEAEYEVSEREIQYFKNMVELFHEFLCENELMNQRGDLDMDALDSVCESMKKSYDEEDNDE